MSAFEEMGVLQEIAKRVEELDWTLPTDVQAEAIPLILGGGDVLMAAETGSGKTGAFCLPILQIVWETRKDLQQGKGSKLAHVTPVPDQWGLSLYDRSLGMAVTPDGLRCQSREAGWNGVRCVKGVINKGCYYYECAFVDEGLCRVGWSSPEAALDLGTDKYGFGFGGTGKKSNNRQFDDYGEPFGLGDSVGCLLDLDQGEVSFTKNGRNLGMAFRIPPPLRRNPFFPACCVKNAELNFNFGDQPFKFGPPPGYVPLINTPDDFLVNNSATGGAPLPAKPGKASNNAPQALILEPSRELAEQTYKEINNFKKYMENPNIHTVLTVGGVNAKAQIAELQEGVDIVVGTPGRIDDLVSSGNIVLSQIRFFVLDEADGLLQQNHGELINRLHAKIPKLSPDGKRLQMIVCSATLHSFDVKKMAERLMHFPTWVDLKGEDAVPETVHHVVVPVDPLADKSWTDLKTRIRTDGVHAKDFVPNSMNSEALSEGVKILKGEYCVRALREHIVDQALIFCRTKLDCDNLEPYLKHTDAKRFSCVCLHADRKAEERQANLEAFKRKEVKLLICTDVAARGLDISGLPLVINMTLPDEKSNYLHRIGRVGRAERMGLAISLVSTVPEKVWYHGQWCSSRGKNCQNTNLVEQRGCCIWYNEQQCLGDIEDHLGITIQQVESDIKVPIDEFDGKVIYGQKRKQTGSMYQTHVAQMAPAVQELATLEAQAQTIFLKRHYTRVR